jgi:hypothetical protein
MIKSGEYIDKENLIILGQYIIPNFKDLEGNRVPMGTYDKEVEAVRKAIMDLYGYVCDKHPDAKLVEISPITINIYKKYLVESE